MSESQSKSRSDDAPLPCPFCDSTPGFRRLERDEPEYYGYHMELQCCITMRGHIGWREANTLTESAMTERLRRELTERWNNRAPVSERGTLTAYVEELERRAAEQKGWEAHPKCEDNGVGDAMQVIANELREKFLTPQPAERHDPAATQKEKP